MHSADNFTAQEIADSYLYNQNALLAGGTANVKKVLNVELYNTKDLFENYEDVDFDSAYSSLMRDLQSSDMGGGSGILFVA